MLRLIDLINSPLIKKNAIIYRKEQLSICEIESIIENGGGNEELKCLSKSMKLDCIGEFYLLKDKEMAKKYWSKNLAMAKDNSYERLRASLNIKNHSCRTISESDN